MYIKGFEGSWFDHPFWRSRFVIEDQDDLARVRDSKVAAVIVDIAKSRMKPEAVPSSTPEKRDAPAAIATARTSFAADRATSFLNENARAAKTVDRSKRIIRRVFEDARLGKAVRSGDVMPIVDEITDSLERSPKALLGVIRLKSKEEYTCLHSVAVCVLMVNLGRHLQLPETIVHNLGMAGLLHDVGKMTLPSEVLNKPGRLNDDEFAIIRQHPERGFALLSEGTGVPQEVFDVCRHHHEKMDGSGYPFGSKGDDISLAARMAAICDVYDALSSNRVYKDAWTPVESVSAMLSWDGHFDAKILFAFMQSVSVFPTGMLVRLRSNRLAVVLENGRRATRPRVKAFYATREREMLPPEVVIIDDSLAHDQIISMEDPRHWALDSWSEMQMDLLRDA